MTKSHSDYSSSLYVGTYQYSPVLLLLGLVTTQHDPFALETTQLHLLHLQSLGYLWLFLALVLFVRLS